eukprot:m.47201 g.47201  ORF g.47201 m.47201 type:complete len:53 (+) comp8830_c0_seq1:3073-3231(+)
MLATDITPYGLCSSLEVLNLHPCSRLLSSIQSTAKDRNQRMVSFEMSRSQHS